ncbi:MAG TPA: hypothetical protein VFV52_14165 [Bacilli bacterium]|nr:hypothetical protein [Bacilli bacterium]
MSGKGWRNGRIVSAVVWLLVLLLLLSGVGQSAGATSPRPLLAKKAVLLLIDGLRLQDIKPDTTPHLWQMARQGAVGVMNHNVLGARHDANLYLTLGAGSKGATPFSRVEAYGAGEQVRTEAFVVTGRDLYERHLGRAPAGEIVLPQLPQMWEQEERYGYAVKPGLLGDAIHALDGRTAVLGNADFGTDVHRPAVLIAMDGQGTVDAGDLQAGLVPDGTRPYGVRTDVERLYRSYQAVKRDADLVVIESGDLLRLFRERSLMNEGQRERAYLQTLQEADELVGRMLTEAQQDPSLLLTVVSPIKHPDADASPLSPILMVGGQMTPGSLLTSSTTKREGLIADYDIAPTIVQQLGGDPNKFEFLGQPAETIVLEKGSWEGGLGAASKEANATEVVKVSDEQKGSGIEVTSNTNNTNLHAYAGSLAVLANIEHDMLIPNQSRKWLVTPWVDTWIALACLILLAQLLRPRWLRFLQPVAEWMMTLPLAWLIVPLFDPQTVGSNILHALGLAVAIWFCLLTIPQPIRRIGTLAGVTAATLLGDVLTGGALLKHSVLSYDPIVGARYYGIGNEYMGVLLGSLMLSLNIWLVGRGNSNIGVFAARRPFTTRLPYLLAVALCLTTLYLFAAPTLGTNAGGALAGAVGFTYALLRFSRIRFTARTWLWLGVAACGVALAMFGLNAWRPSGEQTHIGRFAGQLLAGDFTDAYGIVSRKFLLNFHLLRVSAWGKLFLLFLAVLAVWEVQQKFGKRGKRELATNPFPKTNLHTVLVLALAAFFFNDSGVVAAALALLYAVVPLLSPTRSAQGHPVELEEIPPPSQ